TLLPLAFAHLRSHAPGLSLILQRGSTPGLLHALKAGEIDAAVLLRPPSGGSNRLVWTALLSETFTLVVPRSVESSDVKAILRQHPWIRLDRNLVAGSLASRFVNQLLPNHQPIIDVPSIDAILAMISTQLGVSVLPALRPARTAYYDVREISLRRNAPVRQMMMVHRTAGADNHLLHIVTQAFQHAVTQYMGDENTASFEES